MMKITKEEQTYTDESKAHRVRRGYINLGYNVSLIAYDPSRDAYVFDVWHTS